MKTVFGVTIVLLLAATWNLSAQQAPAYRAPEPSPAVVDSLKRDPLVSKVRRAALAFQRRNWEQGTVMQGILEIGDRATLIAMAEAATAFPAPDGRVAEMGGAYSDSGMCGEGMWAAAAFTNDPKLRKAADGLLEFILHNPLRAPDGLVYHTPEGGIFYSDTNNSCAPFLAAAGHYDEAMRQFETARRRLWNPKKRLMQHGWSDATQSFKDPHCWGGGNGWTAAAYMRVIRCMGAAQADQRKRLEGYLKELLDGCLAYQRPDGLFHDVIDEPQTYVETNLSAMLAYAIYQSVRGGWLPPATSRRPIGCVPPFAPKSIKTASFGAPQGPLTSIIRVSRPKRRAFFC